MKLLPSLGRLLLCYLFRCQPSSWSDGIARNLPDGSVQLGVDLGIGLPEGDTGAFKGVLLVLLESLGRGLASGKPAGHLGDAGEEAVFAAGGWGFRRFAVETARPQGRGTACLLGGRISP